MIERTILTLAIIAGVFYVCYLGVSAFTYVRGVDQAVAAMVSGL